MSHVNVLIGIVLVVAGILLRGIYGGMWILVGSLIAGAGGWILGAELDKNATV